MSTSKHSSELHIAMFPWFAFGHIIPYLHLSNKLAEKGHKISFLLPKGAQSKLENLSHYPNLIRFFPLVVPPLQGLPPGSETASDVPQHLHNLIAIGFDQTRDQVESILRAMSPDMVFYDLGHWIPSVAHQIGNIKPVMYAVVSTTAATLITKKLTTGMSLEDLIQVPPGYPSSKVKLKAEEAIATVTQTMPETFGTGLSLQDRILSSIEASEVMACRTYRELEGPFCDYVAQHFGKPFLLTGPCLTTTFDDQIELEEKWSNWLSKFETGSVVFCAFGSQTTLQRNDFQELVLGLELSGQPFLASLKPPQGCTTIEEAFPQGFQQRVQGRGLVYSGWVPNPQELFLSHPSVGCCVNHCGYGTMWESLLSNCQIVLIPQLADQVMSTRLLVEELKVAVEVERGENMRICKDKVSKAIKLVMDKDNEMAHLLKTNHAELKKLLSNPDLQDEYITNFIQGLHDLIK